MNFSGFELFWALAILKEIEAQNDGFAHFHGNGLKMTWNDLKSFGIYKLDGT